MILVLNSLVHNKPNTINYYDWGVILRFEDAQGLQLPKPKNA